MSLEMDIRNLLRTNQAKEINFLMRGLRVTGYGFLELSNYFSNQPIPNRIDVSVDFERVHRDFDAEYDSDADELIFRSPYVMADDLGRALVIHECTHAQLDLRARSSATRTEEAAALIAQMWYLLANQTSNDRIDQNFSSELRILVTNLRNRANGMFGTPVEVSPDQINDARRMVAHYPMNHYVSNGIGGRRYRGD